LAVTLFGACFGIWLLSHNGGVLCDPDSWLQGHGLWHLGGAATALLLYFYMRSERFETLAGAADAPVEPTGPGPAPPSSGPHPSRARARSSGAAALPAAPGC